MSGTMTPRKPAGNHAWGSDVLPNLRDTLETLLSKVWEDQPHAWAAFHPLLDVVESGKAIEVRIDLPGVNPEDIDISLNRSQLTVRGERHEEKHEKGKRAHRIERRMGEFSRTFPLPCPVNEEEVVAEHRDGILTITLPKTEEDRSRRIKVKH